MKNFELELLPITLCLTVSKGPQDDNAHRPACGAKALVSTGRRQEPQTKKVGYCFFLYKGCMITSKFSLSKADFPDYSVTSCLLKATETSGIFFLPPPQSINMFPTKDLICICSEK